MYVTLSCSYNRGFFFKKSDVEHISLPSKIREYCM